MEKNSVFTKNSREIECLYLVYKNHITHEKEKPMKTQMDLLGNTSQRVRILETLHLY